MRKYWFIFQTSLQQSFSYRGEIVFRTIRHLVIAGAFIMLWTTVLKKQATVGSFTRETITTYYILAEIVDIIYSGKPAKFLTEQIQQGELSNFLTRPINYWLYNVCYILGIQIGTSSLSFVVVGLAFILFPSVVLGPASFLALVCFLFSIILSWLLYFQLFHLIGLLTFWLSETSYTRVGLSQIINLLAGKWVPLSFFSGTFGFVVGLLPFQFLISGPIKIYQGSLTGLGIFQALAFEILWLGFFIWLGSVTWSKGIRLYQSYGK